MATIKDFFKIKELVCKDVYDKFGEAAWAFLDPRLLQTLLFIRTNIGKPMTINTWSAGGKYSQRGYRCNLCELVKTKKTLYASAHMEGMAADFDADGMTAEEVRTWLYNNRERLPYPIRVEKGTNWVHIDVRTTSTEKITYFTA